MIFAISVAPSAIPPNPKIAAPRAMPFSLPTELARCPPKKELIAAGMRIIETVRPWTVDERWPKDFSNCAIVVSGPIVPVSRLNKRELHIEDLRIKHLPEETTTNRN